MDLRRPVLAFLLLAGPAAAQTAPDPATPAAAATALTPAPMPDPLAAPDLQRLGSTPPSLPALVQQSAWQDAVIAAARAQYKQIPDACSKAEFKPTGQLTIYTPAAFDQHGALLQGIWSESVDVTGCPGPHQLNVLTVLAPGAAAPSRIPTMPGTTHADPETQKNALQYAQAVAIRAAPPGCRSLSFINTQFEGYTGLPNPDVTDGRPNRAWREDWTLYACGSTYDITLTFTPNAQGLQLQAANPVKRS